MQNILCAWLGDEDLKAMEDRAWPGPIAQSIRERRFDRLLLLSSLSPARTRRYAHWLEQRTHVSIELFSFDDVEMTNFSQLYQLTREVVLAYDTPEGMPNYTFNISSGTPLTGAIWIILSKFHLEAEIIRASVDLGVETIDTQDGLMMPNLLGPTGTRKKRKIKQVLPEVQATYDLDEDFASEDPCMASALEIARRAAPYDVGVLITGESGTGRTHLAQAIHQASQRSDGPCVVIDPRGKTADELRKELFGHARSKDNPYDVAGHVEVANGGTLILERLAQFPMEVQIDLARLMGHGSFCRPGDPCEMTVDIRFIGTARGGIGELVAAGRVHESLYLRLAVALIRLPPLRERAEDFNRLVDSMWQETNQSFGSPNKELTEEALQALRDYSWPGNIRELRAILARAILWSDTDKITAADVDASIKMSKPSDWESLGPFGRSFGGDGSGLAEWSNSEGTDVAAIPEDFSIQEHLDQIARQYLLYALEVTGNNKTKTAELLGLKSYQSVSNWMRRLGVKPV